MLVHANPMTQIESGYWEDMKLNRVFVRPILVNYGNHRKRWVVYHRRTKGKSLSYISKHITEAQAVVSAQTLANRLYRQITERKDKTGKLSPTLHIQPEDKTKLTQKLNQIITQANQAESSNERWRARKILQMLESYIPYS
jgi:3-dehydroquinate synthetase